MSPRILALFAIGLVVSFALVQGMFDDADHAKALALVHDYRLGGARPRGPTLANFLAARHPERTAPPTWSTRISSGCRGIVRVTCTLPRQEGAVVYRFDADLVRRAVHPAEPRAKDALEAFAGPQ